MATYKTVKTSQGYAVQKIKKVLCFTFLKSVYVGNIDAVNNYINSLNNAFIVFDF